MLRHLILVLRLLPPVATGWLLAQHLSPWAAIGLSFVTAAALCLTGFACLRQVRVGELSWRNHLAGWLLPWGYRLGRGQLARIVVISWLVWSLLATAAVWAGGARWPDAADTVPTAVASGPDAPGSVLLLLAWIVDGVLLWLVLGAGGGIGFANAQDRTRLRVVLVLGALLVGSLVLFFTAHVTLALWVAGGPPLLVGLCYGVFMGVVVLAGRKARWN